MAAKIMPRVRSAARCRALEGRAKVTGPGRIHPQPAPSRHAARQDFPQHAAACAHQADRHAAPPRAVEGVHRVVTIDDVRTVIPDPYYGPAFHDQPILADGKVRFAGEPVAVVLAADRTSPKKRRR